MSQFYEFFLFLVHSLTLPLLIHSFILCYGYIETLLSNPTRLSPTDEWIKESTLTSFFGPLFATDRPYRGIRKDALDHGDNEHWKAPALEAETETESLSIPNPYN